MIESVLAATFVVLVVALFLAVRGARTDEEVVPHDRPQYAVGRRENLICLAVAIAVGLVLAFWVGAPDWISVAAGALALIAARVIATLIVARRATKTELRLADAIDLMVSALRAGSSLLEALDDAAASSRAPVREMLEELSDRVRVGERHDSVLEDINRKFGLESVRIFTFSLSAHWEGGGSLATSLSNVGKSVRDRVDVTRRVQSQSVETQASVIGILVITYGLALLMWSNYPERVGDFVTSELGSMFIAASIVLQAIGLFWINTMTKVEV